MTATTTPRDFRSPVNGHVPNLDSPGVSTPARARVAVTDSDGNRKTRRSSPGSRLASGWVWNTAPASYSETWQASRVDRKRIPNNAGLLLVAWHVSNWTDRLIMFALIQIAPAFLTGPMRWIAQRPSRRIGFYLTLTALTIALLIGRT